MKKIIPVIMAGGSGTRLWPKSRSLYPKQFLPLASNLTMLQETFKRVESASTGAFEYGSPIVICNEEHRFMVAEQARELGVNDLSIILEPVGKNTAPAIALGCMHALSLDPNAYVVVLAADHVMTNVEAFHDAVAEALTASETGQLVTFGIVPTSPETGYGYIRSQCSDKKPIASIDKFVEKPDLETAQEYLDSGEYLWNSGMFLFSAETYLKELAEHQMDIHRCVKEAYDQRETDLDFTRVNKEAFEASPEDSIDYAVMEKTERACVVRLDAGWNDIGSWSALWEHHEKDADNNVLKGDVIAVNSSNTYIDSDCNLVAALGVDNLVIVNTPNALLVANKDRVQDIKTIVNQLKAEGRSEGTLHREVARPWGSYDSIDMGERFQVKRITVKPGGKLSLQMHHHRAEHWIVVSGSAMVTIGEKTTLLAENESTYIPIGVTHRLENPGVLPLEMIEVQSGSYLGEDDIVRFEDTYGRS